MSGLLIGGKLYQVAGREILSPDEYPWVQLNRGDGITRTTKPQMWIFHKTIADIPERVVPGVGPTGGDEIVAKMWDKDQRHSGAQLITSCSGRTAALEDLWYFQAWGANQANSRAVNHEMKEMAGGVVYRVTIDAAVDVCLEATKILGIQWQCPSRYTDNHVLTRFDDGGSSLVGIFGHRDVITSRNRWDPGDEVFNTLRSRGVESFDFVGFKDRSVWAARQQWLKKQGVYSGQDDGIPGPRTTLALKQVGCPFGIYALGRRVPGLLLPR